MKTSTRRQFGGTLAGISMLACLIEIGVGVSNDESGVVFSLNPPLTLPLVLVGLVGLVLLFWPGGKRKD